MTPISLDVILISLRLSGLLSLGVAYSAWRRRPAAGSTEFALLMSAAAYWSLTYAAGLNTSGMENKLILNQVTYIAIAYIPVLWLFFSLRYTGTAKLSRKQMLLLLLMPTLTTIIIWTNNTHQFFWSNISLQTEGVITSVANTRKTWFWIHTTYSYICLITGAYFLLRSLGAGNSSLYRGQAIALAIGVFAPWIANATYIFELFPIRLLDPTPFGFTLTGLAISWAIYRFRLLDILPAARDAVLASMTDGVIVLDARNRIVEINPSAEKFLRDGDSSLRQLIGADASLVLSQWPHVVERFQDVTHAYATAIPFQVGNRTRYVDVRISPIRDAAGKITGRVLVTSDVTSQKLTADLQKAKETAEASSLAKSAFLASMSHELRTPLNHIIGYSELLQEEVEANRHQDLYCDDLQKIHHSGKHLLDIITQILELARLEARMVALNKETFPLPDLVEDVITQIQPLLEKNNSQLGLKLPDDKLQIYADLAKIRQVIYNVLHNAVRFTEQGRVDVEVGAQDGMAFIRVQDSGPGIPPERLATIFEAFANPESASRKKTEGLGLGLATAQQFARLMNGEIGVVSKVGRGSTFTIQLPLGVKPKE
jgi:signal transduction histidine kinase